jgi:lipoxygenase homology domain-containing protein 1
MFYFHAYRKGAAWHLNRVEIRRLLKGQKARTFIFNCDRWFAKNEDDKAIVRDLVPDKSISEKLGRDGHVKVRESDIDDRLESKANDDDRQCYYVFVVVVVHF